MKSGLVHEFRAALDDILDAWFPRVIDREHGGFLCDFDHRWKPRGPQNKMLEFQARQTRLAGIAAEFLPERDDLRAAVEHGFTFLRDAMWDQEHGGFYRMVDRAGSPLEERTKHGHGTAYAISACVVHHRVTGSDVSLDLTKRGFDWLEQHGHDTRHGGYFGYYRREGRPILGRDDSIPDYPLRDPIGTPLGMKDVNTNKDLMETLGQVAGIWPNELVLARLREMLDLVCQRVIVPPGTCHMYFHPDWTPIPHCAHYGHNVHLAAVLLNAADPLETGARGKAVATSRALLDTALEYSWVPGTGGFAYAGSAFGPVYLEDQVWYLDRKYWWPQVEGLVALVHFATKEGKSAYSDRAAALWRYIRTHLIDHRHGGWFPLGLDAGKWVRRLTKASVWRDGSHEGMGLIKCIRILEADG